MDTAKRIRASFKKLQSKIKSGKEISEKDVKVINDFLRRF
jgi:hypothetical protein